MLWKMLLIPTSSKSLMKTRKNCKIHTRPRIQRAFLSWLIESRSRLKITFRVIKRTEKLIYLESVGTGDLNIYILLTQSYSEVSYCWRHGPQNSLITNPFVIEKIQNGYRYKENLDAEDWGNYIHDVRNYYPKREDVWRVHVFELIFEAINSITKFPWVELYMPLSWNAFNGEASYESREDTKQPDFVLMMGSIDQSGGTEMAPSICARLITSSGERLRSEVNFGLSGELIPNPLYVGSNKAA